MTAEPAHNPAAERPDLTGQVAVVTGGGRGLGRAFATALAAAGAAVAVAARSAAELEATVSDIERAGGRALAHATDVTDASAVAALMDRVEASFGPITLLVNNAGAPSPLGPLAENEADAWWRCVEVNLRGPMLCMREVLPRMIARRRGRIVNIASGAGTRGLPYFSAYATSKAALIRLTEIAAVENAPHGVAVFAIEPGTVRTAMAEHVLESPDGRRWMPWFREIFESGRDVTPERAAELVVFLASGQGDALAGRLVSRADDPAALARSAEDIVRRDLLVLRLRGLEQGGCA
ncbi:MAG TPA: SDR family oxidoreductase [Gemmatimonadales bacterium]|nr:SDR family oxidoreductase [Gemmatimonadales bacterium]